MCEVEPLNVEAPLGRTIVQYHMHCALYLHQIVFPQQEFSALFAIMTTLSYSFSFVFARCDVSKVDVVIITLYDIS